MVNKVIEEWGFKYFKCKKCWEVKPLNKCYFHINTMYSTGFNSKCKSCVNEERESKPKVKYITRVELEEENKKLKEENQYRESVADVLPEWRGHIAEETIQDLQNRIDELVWFEKEYHRSRERIKKLEWVLEHDYDRKIPY